MNRLRLFGLITAMVLRWLTAAGQVFPDNVDSASCTAASTSFVWGIEQDWASTEMVSPLVIPLVGDIDGDHVPEIICFTPDEEWSFYGASQVVVYNTQSHQPIHTFTLPGQISTVDAAPYGIVKLPNDHVIFVAVLSSTMCAYDLTAFGTTPLWSTTISDDYGSPNVSFADFNSDSYPEIYIGNRIYDAETGALLISDPSIANSGTASAHSGWLTSSFAADVVGDSRPDLILGNEIYEVTITNRNGLTGNSITLSTSITPPAGIGGDGHAQVADFNQDGHLDVFVSTSTFTEMTTIPYSIWCYVWDVHNNTVSDALRIPTRDWRKSIPLIADVNNDGRLEIVIQCPANSGHPVKCYRYNIVNQFVLLWDLPVDEDSFSNSMTMFDFNNDGENELLISDQSTVRIVNGSGRSHLTGNDTVPVYTLASLSFGECTVMQYPIVAGLDEDGSARIIICGRFGSGHTYQGYLNIFKSAGVPWVSARKVWNQYMYNVTNVNEDLSVPLHLFNNATAFTDPDNVVRRPFNNFLQQATTIDRYGRPFSAVPDVAVDSVVSSQSADDSTLAITISYCNIGYNTLSAPYPITVLANEYGGEALCTIMVTDDLPMDSCTQATIVQYISDPCDFSGIDHLVVAVNCAGEGIAQNGGLPPECDTTNNTASVEFSLTIPFYHIEQHACESYVWNGQLYEESGEYSQTFISSGGCDSVVVLHLTIHHAVAELVEATVCKSDLPYRWNGVTFTEDGTQTAVLQSSYGCDSIVTMTLHSVDNDLEVTLLTDDLCEDFEAELLAESNLPNYLWSTGETTPQITVYQSGIYWITASDGLCVATDRIAVKSCDCHLYLPTAITPTDPDGINDYFYVPQRSDRQIQALEIVIYNRWGEMVYRSEDKHFRWRGDVNGKIIANATYAYVIRWTNNSGKECMVTGSITVL
ncbi:MAG: VCBS repeat-containing protein [Bacteroidales bacterium]|nr:VCBS repeat-containing protein [Bacteroidales bacterium]